MDIRTMLIFAFVAVALASMTALGAFAYQATASMLERVTLRQLDALAESKKRDLRKTIEGWRDQVRLIASRTQLRASVVAYAESGDAAEQQRMRRIRAPDSDLLEPAPAVAPTPIPTKRAFMNDRTQLSGQPQVSKIQFFISRIEKMKGRTACEG